jgi:hypothetical protein
MLLHRTIQNDGINAMGSMQWDQTSFVHWFCGPDDGLDMGDAGRLPFLDPGQDDPRFSIRATSIASFIIIVLLCRLVLTPQLSCQKHSPASFAFALERDIVDQHIMDMEQGALMGSRVTLLNHTMVWLRFFFLGWSKKYQFLPRPTVQREHGSECHHKKRPQLLSAALQDSAIIQKIAGKFPVHVWGRLCDSPVLAAAGVMGAERAIIP